VRNAVWLAMAVLLLWSGFVMLRRRLERSSEGGGRAQGSAGSATEPDDAIDVAALEAAEREVRDMGSDLRGAPSEDETGTDWGPGSPRNPWGHAG
jgi:hypothetical protein